VPFASTGGVLPTSDPLSDHEKAPGLLSVS